MGRTNPTYRDVLAAIESRWGDYRRGLRVDAREAFDRLFEYARAHADAAGYLNHHEPIYGVFVSIALEQERRLDAQAARIAELEARLADDDPAVDADAADEPE